MIAVSLKDGEELVDLFLRKEADVNAKSTSLFAFLSLLKAYSRTPDFSGQTALHFTASKNNLDVARHLLEGKPPASARVRDKRGQYAIHRAAAVGSAPMVELLLKNKSPLNATDVAGQTPLHHAIAEGHGDTAVALLKAGAETDKKDSDGFLALELAPDAQVTSFYPVSSRENTDWPQGAEIHIAECRTGGYRIIANQNTMLDSTYRIIMLSITHLIVTLASMNLLSPLPAVPKHTRHLSRPSSHPLEQS